MARRPSPSPASTPTRSRPACSACRSGRSPVSSPTTPSYAVSRPGTWSEISDRDGTDVWTGTVDVEARTNAEVVTAIPVSLIVGDLEAGVYVLTAKAANAPASDYSLATQWFVVSEIGLTTLQASDGFHVLARSLDDAAPLTGVALDLVAVNNAVLASVVTDGEGHARIPAALLAGTGGDRPAVLTAARGDDFVFLDLTAAPFDLADRGVEGRAPAGPLDVFLTLDRGIYRTGETAYLTGTVRDAAGDAVPPLTLTGIVRRPDGAEHARTVLRNVAAGGFVWEAALPEGAMRGRWTFAVHSDPERAPLASTTALVADFEPEKIDAALVAGAETLDPADPAALTVDARYLFGAPATDLEVAGEAILRTSRTLAAHPAYTFGLAAEDAVNAREPFEPARTDAEGRAVVGLSPFPRPSTTRPLSAELQVRVIDTDGRPIERTETVPVTETSGRLGLRPRFDDAVAQGAEARFDVIAIDAAGGRVALPEASWRLERITERFQWYSLDGQWNYEPIETRSLVANGTLAIGDDLAATLAETVDWGRYELRIEDVAGALLPVSARFSAGWYVAAASVDTPDAARVSLDKPRYAVGDTARVHVEARFAGPVEVLVLDERVVARVTAEIGAEGGTVEIPVTRDWGPGAYVVAIAYRPMDAARMPGRALGLAHAQVDPGDRALDVAIEAPERIAPRSTLDLVVTVEGVAEGEDAYLTLAMADEGILNITGFAPPSLSDHYFGQRRLGVLVRDLYGRLIDRMQGALGRVRSGGDASASFESPPPMDDLVTAFVGPLEVGADGRVAVSLDVPDFNGALTLSALAWSGTGVGEASVSVVARDPVVIAAARPRFLAPGDISRIALDLTHVEGPAGAVSLALTGGEGVVELGGTADWLLDLGQLGRARALVSVRALAIGDAEMEAVLTLPGGDVLTKAFTLPVRSLAPETVSNTTLRLASGAALDLGPDLLADMVPGTAAATVSITGALGFDVAGVVRDLDRYPYGCTEQTVSRAIPLVYLDRTILAAGLGEGEDAEITARVQTAIETVLANQASNGSFGLWRPDGGDLWLDAYVTDFLTRAREAGYAVAETPFRLAIDALRNGLAYLPAEPDYAPVAYASYVLARNGRAAIGDLRYLADTQLGRFPTPLAKAQVAAALALYGDRVRAERVLRNAVDDAAGRRYDPSRRDFGTALRDDAAVLTLGLETGIDGVDLSGLVTQVSAGRAGRDHTSTQEDAWSLLAAHALLTEAPPRLEIDGTIREGAYARRFDTDDLTGDAPAIVNRADDAVTAEVTVRGVPLVAPPAYTEGYQITRSYYTMEGETADPSVVAQGDRLVAVVEVLPIDEAFARVMVNDPLPAGFEIDNPDILRGGDVAALDIALTTEVAHTEFRAERFLAAFDKPQGDTVPRRFAYVVRAVSPGDFVHPAATVEDMYRPERRGRTNETLVSVVGPLR